MTERSQPPTPEEWKRFLGFRVPEGPGPRRQLMAGLLIGVTASAVVWGLLWNNSVLLVALLFLIGAKLGVAAVCLAMRDHRPFGQGVMLSMAVGGLIFFGRCAMSL